jgi:raffinose/stachyose/melibiose transport system permease protein
MSRRRRNRTGSYAVYLLPGVVLAVPVILVPVIANIGISFTHWQGIGRPHWAGFANYTRLLHDSNFWASFRHIGAMVIAMAVVPTLLGLVLAAVLFDYVAKKYGDRVASLFRSGLYLPQVLPAAVTGIVWGWLLAPTGAINSLLKDVGLSGQTDWLGNPSWALLSVMLVLIWVQLGYPVVMFMAGLQRIDPQLYEAADLDGASWWQRFRHITVHLIRPEFYVVLVTTTIAALKVFAQVFVLTSGGPGNATLVPSYFAYKNFFDILNVGYGSAISSVMTVIIVIVGFVFLRAQTRASESGLS